MTCSKSPVIYCCRKSSVTLGLRDSRPPPLSILCSGFDKKFLLCVFSVSGCCVHHGFNWRKKKQVPEILYCSNLIVSQNTWLWEWVRSLSFPSGEGAAGGNFVCLWSLRLGFYYSFSSVIMDDIYHFNSV